MEDPLGVRYAHWLAQFIQPSDDGTISVNDFLILVEGADFVDWPSTHFKTLDENVLQEFSLKALLEPLREISRDAYGFPCYITKEILENLQHWHPWLALQSYLKSQAIEPFILFKNTVVIRDGVEGYCAEIRFIPLVNLTMEESNELGR